MPLMEDSGIESEDKPSLSNEEDIEQMTSIENVNHMLDMEVIFRDSTNQKEDIIIDSVACDANNLLPIYYNEIEHNIQAPNTCRILQRKLELKVERAKRNYCQYQEQNKRKSQSASLIPINRLSIPGDIEQKPLVDYHNDSDDLEDVSFFPNEEGKQRIKKYAELTDTFSIQEMTIESDAEPYESENLELLTPHLKESFIEYLSYCCCFKGISYNNK